MWTNIYRITNNTKYGTTTKYSEVNTSNVGPESTFKIWIIGFIIE